MTGCGGEGAAHGRDEVLARERRLLEPEVRRSRAALETLLHPEFREVGGSGRRWSRAEIIAELVAGEHPPAPVLEDPRVDRLAEGVVLVTYTVVGRLGRSHRSSLWTRAEHGWQIYFHQGTPAARAHRS